MVNQTFVEIEKLIKENQIVLFMKGTKESPMCGFSGYLVQILKVLSVDFKDVDVLQSPEMRQGIKDFTDWPTIPQLYVRGEFIGGFDIVKEMYEAGEMKDLFKIDNV